jgi:hypothetical protein
MWGKRRQQEFEAAAEAALRATEERKLKREREEARQAQWRTERVRALAEKRAANRAHAKALRAYNLYAPGPQRDAAAAAVNAAADYLHTCEQAFEAIRDYSGWCKVNPSGEN